MNLRNSYSWSAYGSKAKKKEFISLLVNNGFKGFDGRKTARKVLQPAGYIRHVENDRKGNKGNYFISSWNIQDGDNVFNLDTIDMNILIKYIFQGK